MYMHPAHRLNIGDRVVVPDRPEIGICTIADIHRNVLFPHHRQDLYILNWNNKEPFEIDSYLFSELDLPQEESANAAQN